MKETVKDNQTSFWVAMLDRIVVLFTEIRS